MPQPPDASISSHAGSLAGGGELGALIREFDWAKTPLGPIESWPASLKTTVGILLHSPVPIVLLWGEDGIMIYNDAYSVFAGSRYIRSCWEARFARGGPRSRSSTTTS